MGLTLAEEAALARRWQAERDRSAAELMTRAHAGHVMATARRYRRRGLPLADLMAEGYLGVLLALNKFEPERGVPFGAYALLWIRACINSYASRRLDLRCVSFEAEVCENALDVERFASRSNQEQELSNCQSEHRLREQVGRALVSLDPRERYIAEQRLMVDPQDQPSLAQLAQHFQVSRERVGQLEARAKQKLRRKIAEALSSQSLA